MRKVCEGFDAELKEFNCDADHVHLLVHYPPKVALASLVNSLKGVSSRILRRDFTDRVIHATMDGRFWSPSYFAGSCGGAPLSVVKEYIAQQKRPDRRPAGNGGIRSPDLKAGALSQDQR